MTTSKKKRMLPSTGTRLPAFCDYTCPHAGFASNDASGACRREQAVHCTLSGSYNNKNAPCLERTIKRKR